MKRLMRMTLAGLTAALLLAALLACQSAAPEPPVADSGLVPAQGSTGNPPLIPHEVDAADGGEVCLECHRTGEGGAPKYPDWHATLVDCGQCHVAADAKVEPFMPKY